MNDLICYPEMIVDVLCTEHKFTHMFAQRAHVEPVVYARRKDTILFGYNQFNECVEWIPYCDDVQVILAKWPHVCYVE